MRKAIEATTAYKNIPATGKAIILAECQETIREGIERAKQVGYNTWAKHVRTSDLVRDIVLEIYTYHRFPKRFEIEGLNPYDVPVQFVHHKTGYKVYENMAALPDMFWVGMCPFMADKHEGKWCLRLESGEVNDRLSA